MRGILKKKVCRAAPPARPVSSPRIAADVMDRDCVRLETALPLRDALAQFSRHGLPELPVVDEDGHLVGVFSAEDAIRLCVPEHLLWVDDLPDMGGLEWFAAAFKTEARRPLADVVLVGGNHITVSESTPVMQVVRLLAKHGARQALVVERRELRGVVTAHGLINRMLDQ
jgi:CBS domain-containing protein